MKLSEIQDLIKLVSRSGVNNVTIEKPDFKLSIKSDGSKKKGKGAIMEPATVIQQIPMPMQSFPMDTSHTAAPAAIPVAVTPEAPAVSEAESNYIEIKSPMIGTFYRSAGPDKDAFVEVGNTIGEGDVVCIIEAMKLFNEIESEVKGKIVKILVDDSTPVEYDQPLFLVDPS